jgi:hypothetical protein
MAGSKTCLKGLLSAVKKKLKLNRFCRSDVVELMSQVKELISDHEILTSKAFQSKDIDEARLVVAKMQYFVNIKDQLVKKETDMGIIH